MSSRSYRLSGYLYSKTFNSVALCYGKFVPVLHRKCLERAPVTVFVQEKMFAVHICLYILYTYKFLLINRINLSNRGRGYPSGLRVQTGPLEVDPGPALIF